MKNRPHEKIVNFLSILIAILTNVLIQLFLTPFIVEKLGVEANGYIALASNFITYLAIFTSSLNSMCGRFLLIEVRKKNFVAANEYYSSIFIGNFIFFILLVPPLFFFVANIETFINVSNKFLDDVKLIFLFTIINFFIQICPPKWSCSVYISNNIYLDSIKKIFTSIIRSFLILFAFLIFSPQAYYISLIGTLITLIEIYINYNFHKKFTPELKISFKNYKFNRIRELIISGIWSTIIRCGNILLDGIAILIANLCLGPVAMGIISLTKIIPNMLIFFSTNLCSSFEPRVTFFYVEGQVSLLCKEIQNNIRLLSLLLSLPAGILFIYGESFFSLWTPSQNVFLLSRLTDFTLFAVFVSGTTRPIHSLFSAFNKLKIYAIINIIFGFLNIILTFLLLYFTNLELYSIVISYLITTIIRDFIITPTFAAQSINKKWTLFYKNLLQSYICIFLTILSSYITSLIIVPTNWLSLFISIGFSFIISLILFFLFVLTTLEKQFLLNEARRVIPR